VAIWLGLAIGAQFITAITVLIDRHILVRSEHIGKPVVYAFYVSLLSGFVIVLAPFGLIAMPHPQVVLVSLLQAFSFLAAIYCLYAALKAARASDVAPVVGAVSAVTSLILAGIWIDSDISGAFVMPILLLTAGTALISHFHFRKHSLAYALASGALFGLTVFLAKLVYLQTSFIDGFFWTRSMCILAALSLLLMPAWRHLILHGGRKSSGGTRALVLGNKLLAGIAGVMTALAISLGSVSVVNALAGLQFVFLFLLAFLFARQMPIGESQKTGTHGGWQSALGVSLIVIGLAFLYAVHAPL
jgi:uncharacterized membrane protein